MRIISFVLVAAIGGVLATANVSVLRDWQAWAILALAALLSLPWSED
jgi:4-amino-4-deoxy-L-arabinose transferase-like glycosyltransferase